MPESTFDSTDQEVRIASFAAMPKAIRVLDEMLHHMKRGIHMMSGIENDPAINFLAFLLVCRGLPSLWRGREDAVCGYPVQCLTLCRAAFEDWGTFAYVERHPESGIVWVRDVFPDTEISGREPKFKELWETLGEDEEWAKRLYAFLSEYAHPRYRAFKWLHEPATEQRGTQTIRFHVAGYFNQGALEMCLLTLVAIAELFLESVRQLQRRLLGEPVSEWDQQAGRIEEEALRFVESGHHKWSKLVEADDVSMLETQED
jgi:hypothetical protein